MPGEPTVPFEQYPDAFTTISVNLNAGDIPAALDAVPLMYVEPRVAGSGIVVDDIVYGVSVVDATEDPVRMYLMQMGEIPLLTRHQEVTAARHIDRTRYYYRTWMLASDFMLQGATRLLEQVRDGKLRLDRTIEVSYAATPQATTGTAIHATATSLATVGTYEPTIDATNNFVPAGNWILAKFSDGIDTAFVTVQIRYRSRLK